MPLNTKTNPIEADRKSQSPEIKRRFKYLNIELEHHRKSGYLLRKNRLSMVQIVKNWIGKFRR